GEGEEAPDTAPGLSSEACSEKTEEEDSEDVKYASSDNRGAEEKTSSRREKTGARSTDTDLGSATATPAQRARAGDKQIDIQDISGSGSNGRIHKQDVADHASSSAERQQTPVSHQATEVRTEKLKGSRKIVADRMADSSTSIPHVTIDFEVEMDSLI